MSIHWRAPLPPATTSIDLRIEAVPLPAPWNEALARPATVAVHRWGEDCGLPAAGGNRHPVRVVSIPIVRPTVRVHSFAFPEAAALPPGSAAGFPPGKQQPSGRVSAPPSLLCPVASHTRIKPPGDIIKLADRLHYVLQPSLESLMAEGALAFPFRPFPFQFEGIAFLYPRAAAILADEMGLGKPMQAITAIRLLLRRAELRSVLLVCPKPLVTNWQREFAVWAPEVPLMVIEGDQAKRTWQRS